MEFFARDLHEFGKENVNFWTAEDSLVDDLGITNTTKVMLQRLRSKKVKLFDLYQENGSDFLFKVEGARGKSNQVWVTLTKKLAKRIRKANGEYEDATDSELSVKQEVSGELR